MAIHRRVFCTASLRAISIQQIPSSATVLLLPCNPADVDSALDAIFDSSARFDKEMELARPGGCGMISGFSTVMDSVPNCVLLFFRIEVTWLHSSGLTSCAAAIEHKHHST